MDNRLRFGTLAELDAEAQRRREAGHEVLPGDDVKARFGFFDATTEEYLIVTFGNLSAAKIQARVAGEIEPDDIVTAAVPRTDLKIATFIDRMVDTFIARNLFLDYFA